MLERAKLKWEPFPHFVIENVLEEETYQRLEENFPEDQILRGHKYGSNQRIDLHAKDSEQLHLGWYNFVQEHTTRAWWLEVYAIFREAINTYYPQLQLSKPFEWTTAIRGTNPGATLQLDCQPGVNTPNKTKSRVRGPHLDNPIELFAGMLYMCDSEAGLEICKPVKPLEFYGKLEIEDECVETVEVVPCRHNTLVMFLNTPQSIHSVLPRGPSDECRRMVNFIGELPMQLFKTGHGNY